MEILSFDYEEEDNNENDRGLIAFKTKVPSNEDDILFNIDLIKFKSRLTGIKRELLDWILDGYTAREISKILSIPFQKIKAGLDEIGEALSEYFCCSDLISASN